MRPGLGVAGTCRFGPGRHAAGNRPEEEAARNALPGWPWSCRRRSRSPNPGVKGNEHMTGGGALSSALRRRTRSLRRAATGGSAAGTPRAYRRLSGAAPWSRRSLRAARPRLRSRDRAGATPPRIQLDRARARAGRRGGIGQCYGERGRNDRRSGTENRETGDDFRPAFFAIPPIWEDGCAGRSPLDFAGRRIGRVAVRSGGRGRNMRSGVVVGQCGVRRGPAGTRRRSAAA